MTLPARAEAIRGLSGSEKKDSWYDRMTSSEHPLLAL
jgi:hypothetical protein